MSMTASSISLNNIYEEEKTWKSCGSYENKGSKLMQISKKNKQS